LAPFRDAIKNDTYLEADLTLIGKKYIFNNVILSGFNIIKNEAGSYTDTDLPLHLLLMLKNKIHYGLNIKSTFHILDIHQLDTQGQNEADNLIGLKKQTIDYIKIINKKKLYETVFYVASCFTTITSIIIFGIVTPAFFFIWIFK
jgi:hypothetical protein